MRHLDIGRASFRRAQGAGEGDGDITPARAKLNRSIDSNTSGETPTLLLASWLLVARVRPAGLQMSVP
jgi:hypothetical protein